MKKAIKEVVGAGMTLGVGNVVLNQMGYGSIGAKITGPTTKLLNVPIYTSVLGFVNKQTKKWK